MTSYFCFRARFQTNENDTERWSHRQDCPGGPETLQFLVSRGIIGSMNGDDTMLMLLIFAAAVLLVSLGCFLLACWSPGRKPLGPEEYDTPSGKIYEPFRERMVDWIKEARAMDYREVSVISHDGLTLRGRYYQCSPGAPMELMLHGYRGNAERDMGGGVQRAFALGRNALVVDQRGGGRSDGHIITFGVRERYDCLRWVEYITKEFGPQQKIILTGISMGAATVLLTGGMELPDNVVGILADCGYTSAEAIIRKVLHQIHLPRSLYHLVRLGGRLFGGFDLNDADVLAAVERCRVPVIFFHGETDNYVPCTMSRENFEASPTAKKLVTVPDAGHGLSFLVNEERYIAELWEFGNEHWYDHKGGPL